MSAHSESHAASQTTKSIREVLELLSVEFPDVTVSKIRFLESRGLIHPDRSASGYRKFGDEDIERLRWILRQQREHFLPLKVIKGRLEQAGAELFTPSLFESVFETESTGGVGSRLDARFDDDDFNQDPEGPPPRPRNETRGADRGGEADKQSKARDTERSARSSETRGSSHGGSRESRRGAAKPTRSQSDDNGARRSAEALAKAARVDVAFVEELEGFGLIAGEDSDESRTYSEEAKRIVELAARLRGYGIEPRHLRTFKHAAEREAGVLEQVVMPMLQRRNPDAQKRAQTVLIELVELGDQLHEVFVRSSIRAIDRR